MREIKRDQIQANHNVSTKLFQWYRLLANEVNDNDILI